MKKASYYRGLAAQCVLMAADAVPGDESKAALLEMARRWQDLADLAARAEAGAEPLNDRDA